jgi:hypothetical protein
MGQEADVSAELTNPTLSALRFMVGAWDMAITEAAFLPSLQDVVRTNVAFTPIESGALLAMRHGGDASSPPAATWVIGRDDAGETYTVLYGDTRGVSRVYLMSLKVDTWRIWRDNPDFSQRFEATVSPDLDLMTGRWEKRPGGGDWQHDFAVKYSRR